MLLKDLILNYLEEPVFMTTVSVLISNVLLLPVISLYFFTGKRDHQRKERMYNRHYKKILPLVTEVVFLENYSKLPEVRKVVQSGVDACEVLASCLNTMALNFKGEEIEKLKFLFRESGLLAQREQQYIRNRDLVAFRQLLLFGGADEPEHLAHLMEIADPEGKKELLLYLLGKGDVKQFWALNDRYNSLSEWDQLLVIERLFRRTGLKVFQDQFPVHLKDERSKLFVLRLIRRFNLVQHHPMLIFFLSDSVKVESEIISICEQFPTEENLNILKSMFPCKDPSNNHRISKLLRSYGETDDIKELGNRLSEWQTIQFSFAPPFMN